MTKRFFSAALAFFLALSPAGVLGENTKENTAVQVKETAIEMGENAVRYPQLESLADEKVQSAINNDIVEAAQLSTHLLALSTLTQSGPGLQVSYESHLDSAVFSTVISVDGRQANGRSGHSNTALTYDLRTGERVTLAQLFANPTDAVRQMAEIAQATLGDQLSEYMEKGDLLPWPQESFYLDESGITFYYSSEQFVYLSGYAGTCRFTYEELGGLLLTRAGSLLESMGVLPPSATAKETAAQIEKDMGEGKVPNLPVTLGQPMTELIEQYRLVRTPDIFPGGRYFVLEAPAFRGVLLISDNMESGYDHSVLQGVQLRSGSWYGLLIGQAQRENWQAILGKPQETMAFTESMAYDYGLVQVSGCDVYQLGQVQLRFYANQEGTLQAIQVSK